MKKQLLKITLVVLLAFVLVAPVFAQQTGRRCMDGSLSGPNNNCPEDRVISSNTCSGSGLGGVICKVHELLNKVVPTIIALGVVYFVWGVVTYFIASDEEAKKTGRDRIIYGIIGLAVIIGLWGLVTILTDTFGLKDNNKAPTSSELENLLPQ